MCSLWLTDVLIKCPQEEFFLEEETGILVIEKAQGHTRDFGSMHLYSSDIIYKYNKTWF